MDWSDEKKRYTNGLECPFQALSYDCDEHICERDLWSCGDGQCLRWTARLPFQTMYPQSDDCISKRNLNHMCEVSMKHRLWTLPNGMCSIYAGSDDPSLDMVNTKLSDDDRCRYLIRCALSGGFERDCPCNHLNCFRIMADVCTKNSSYLYPVGAVIRPYIQMYYNPRTRKQWTDPTPDEFKVLGSIKCRGFQVWTEEPMKLNYDASMIRYPFTDYILCNMDGLQRNNLSQFQYSETCWNYSRTFHGQSYAVHDVCRNSGECISQYRIGDGIRDCGYHYNDNDEYIIDAQDRCQKLRKHRFRCSENEPSCLIVQCLGDGKATCTNNNDEFLYGVGLQLKDIYCTQREDRGCQMLKEYIKNSSNSNYTTSSLINAVSSSDSYMRFRAYCDAEWQLKGHIDENSAYCSEWICQENEYQCQTGQCINIEWLCDGEWDCSDASDEQAALIIRHWSLHNQQLNNSLHKRLENCAKHYSNQPFSNKCDLQTEFPCYLANTTNPLDIETNKPCIKIEQIGDGIEQCYNGWDEKNTVEGSDGKMLGFSLRCAGKYYQYPYVCLGMTTDCEDSILCSWRSTTTVCSGSTDVICLNGTCVENARCNGFSDCSYGEDEYWCPALDSSHSMQSNYRFNKRWSYDQSEIVYYPTIPHQQEEIEKKNHHSTQSNDRIQSSFQLLPESYYCNRGMAALWYTDQIICFCPSAYFGNKCQYFSDRLTVITHVDRQTISSKNFFKIKINLVKNDQIIDHFQFHSDPADEQVKKQRFYLLYSRSKESLEQKQWRYSNKTDINNYHPYSVHFDIYALDSNGSIEELGSWRYPIYFDFMPSFRLATVLRFPSWFENATLNPCIMHNPCNANSLCKPVLNQNNTVYCACKGGFYGLNCQEYELLCDYCSSNAVCKPQGRGVLTNTEYPFCLCPLGYFGPRCNLRYEHCDSSPCSNNGSCHLTFDPSGITSFFCVCSKLFYGDLCQFERHAVRIELNASNIQQSVVSVVQYYNVHNNTLKLLLQHQQVYEGLPTVLHYNSDLLFPPIICVLKTHHSAHEFQYFIIYIQPNASIINITSTPVHCPIAQLLLPKSESVDIF